MSRAFGNKIQRRPFVRRVDVNSGFKRTGQGTLHEAKRFYRGRVVTRPREMLSEPVPTRCQASEL